MKYGGSFILVTTITEKKFYTHEDLLAAMSKPPENEAIHKELDIYNGMNKLYDMLPVIDCKYYEKMEPENENACSKSACEEKKDVVE